jgi:hypothetical protein
MKLSRPNAPALSLLSIHDNNLPHGHGSLNALETGTRAIQPQNGRRPESLCCEEVEGEEVSQWLAQVKGTRGTYQDVRYTYLLSNLLANFYRAKRNSLKSPLLRLPAELRNKIFAFALGGHDITIYSTIYSTTSCLMDHTFGKDFLSYTAVSSDKEAQGFVKPAFQLPRVCRQIYSETATLAYVLNTFKFDRETLTKNKGKYSGNGYSTMDLWLDRLLPAQIKAIQSLQVSRWYWRRYVSGLRPAFRNRFPGLKWVVAETVEGVRMVNGLEIPWKQYVEEKVRWMEQGAAFRIEGLWP